jgi:hypothetical protein
MFSHDAALFTCQLTGQLQFPVAVIVIVCGAGLFAPWVALKATELDVGEASVQGGNTTKATPTV